MLRLLGTVGTSLVHFYLALLAIVGRLNYTVDSKYQWIENIARADYWAGIHGATGILIVLALHWRRFEGRACSASWAVMMTWGLFNLMWGLTTVRAVSLVAPGLAAFVALGSFVLSRSWDVQPLPKKQATVNDEG